MMLGLKLPTDPRWVNIVEKNLQEILVDHAFCELKAASTAMSLINSFPEYTELVEEMMALIKEEMSHFELVHDKIKYYGFEMGLTRKDPYVSELMKFFPKGGSIDNKLVNRLLYAALIEARSCERFKLLSEQLEDQELAKFYRDLMVSEANHYTMFLNFARKYQDRKTVDKKWLDLLEHEASIMQSFSKEATMHG